MSKYHTSTAWNSKSRMRSRVLGCVETVCCVFSPHKCASIIQGREHSSSRHPGKCQNKAAQFDRVMTICVARTLQCCCVRGIFLSVLGNVSCCIGACKVRDIYGLDLEMRSRVLGYVETVRCVFSPYKCASILQGRERSSSRHPGESIWSGSSHTRLWFAKLVGPRFLVTCSSSAETCSSATRFPKCSPSLTLPFSKLDEPFRWRPLAVNVMRLTLSLGVQTKNTCSHQWPSTEQGHGTRTRRRRTLHWWTTGRGGTR